jgi:excisionase family DNA binding protein
MPKTIAPPIVAQEVFDKPEAAAFLRIKTRTLDEWMKKRRVPYLKLPSGAVRFRKDQLLEFISKFERTANVR